MQQIRSRLTYSNVMVTILAFVVLGGGTAYAASHLGKNSVGTKQLKANSVTAAKIKKGAITTPKIGAGAIKEGQIANGAVTGAKVNAATLGIVPNATNATNSATTNVVKGSKGVLAVGQEATAFEYGPFKVTAKCEQRSPTEITSKILISSSTAESVFVSWSDGGRHLGPTTPESEREIDSTDSNGPFRYEGPSDANVSATATNGQSFNAWIGEAAEQETNTCWYWLTANIIN